MGAKLTYQDVLNDELIPGKIVNSPNINVSTGSGAPVYSTQGGSLYVDSTAGTFYINNSGASGSTWVALASSGSSLQNGHYRKQTLGSATVASSTSSAPQVGDLVGIYGAGAWATSGTLPGGNAVFGHAGSGSQNAAWIAGGSASNIVSSLFSQTQLFNGTTWSDPGAGSIMTQAKQQVSGTGSQNAALAAGGITSLTNGPPYGANTFSAWVSTSELWNGASWSASGATSQTKYGLLVVGSAAAGLIAGGATGASAATNFTTVELFNGSVWTVGSNGSLTTNGTQGCVGAGSQNAALMAGGFSGGATQVSLNQLFNGSTWIYSGNLISTRGFGASGGSQNAAWATGAFAAVSSSELFNGSVWMASGTMTITSSFMSGAGSQGNGLAAGGISAAAGSISNVTELHSQTTYRKIYSRYAKTAKSLGINLGSNNILLQGYDNTTTYPPNVFLVMNPSMVTAIANETDLSGTFSISSIAGGGTSWGYTLNTATSMLQVMPGMILISTSATNPLNNGTFLINFVNNTGPTITVTNASGVAQLTPAGNVKIISSLIAKTVVSEQDIVIGTTDASGFITLIRAPVTSSVLARFR